MSSIIVAGDTSGTVTLQAPAVAGTTTLTLPATTATLITDSSAALNIGSGQVYKDASGNVGIGTTSPSYRLDLFGTNCSLQIRDIGQTNGLLLKQNNSDGGNLIYATNNNYLALGTNNTERMRIDTSGNVLVGTTTQIIDELFGVNQAGASKSAIIAKAATTGSAAIRTVKVTNVNNSTQLHLAFAYNNGANGNGAIAGNGDSQAAFATFSDSRLKKNIEDLPNQLDKINALRPVEFDYIKSGEHQIGFIAQEVREVYPDLVAEGEDEMLTVIGLGKTEARLIKAIQEQQELIKQLQADVAALKGAA